MLKTLTAITKELLLLKRDRAGLLILFIMPAILVIIITLVQVNVMELTGQNKTRMLLLDQDEGFLGKSLHNHLTKGNIEIVALDGKSNSSSDVENAVVKGSYQVGLVIAPGSSSKLKEGTALLFETDEQHKETPTSSTPTSVHVFFDPGIMPGLRSGLTAQLQMALQSIAMELKIGGLSAKLNSMFESFGVPKDLAPVSAVEIPVLMSKPTLTLEEGGKTAQDLEIPPYNPVQQNVVAWALFGMFFTSLPIAGAILEERKSGIWIRLTSLPTSHLLLFVGKVLANIAVCLCQFLLICLIGIYFFPTIGLPAFTITENLDFVLLTVLLSSLAVCGYGIFLGICCNTYQQAFTIGASTIVAAAAIGGVMVPVYAMPEAMQHLSIISPLNWGLTAFQDLIIRGHSLSAIVDDLSRLAIFSMVTVLFAWRLSLSRKFFH